MENLSTLMGKYGEEGDKLLFKVLNSGDWRAALDADQLQNGTIGALTNKISEKGLRYDLTVPFARFVTQYRNDISFPFKRFQIQPVWRADRPQKGRYREFYQCDVDVVGTDSLVSELELIQIVEEVYRRLGINVCLKLNNRKILSGIAEVVGAADKIVDITVAIDKLDKIGLEKVNEELKERGLSEEQVHILNISSSSGLRPAWTPYQLSKWGINGFTKGLADLLIPYGIVVNGIAPGPTATRIFGKEIYDDYSFDLTPSKRFSAPASLILLTGIILT